MMNCTPYFHTNYTSSNTDYYTKVSVEVGNIGLFCVVRNKHNGSLQHQRYIYAQKPCNHRWYRGNSQEGFYKGLDNLDWANISDEEKRNLYDCVKSLRYAKTRFMSVANLSAEDFDYLNDYVNGLITDFEYLYQNGNLPPQSAIPIATPITTPTPTAETQSTPISAEDTQSNATPAEKPIVRKTIQMAQMLDNKNLTEFVNGCFYRIVNNNTANQFIGIANDNGETRMVKRNRVNIVNIYAEPPQA